MTVDNKDSAAPSFDVVNATDTDADVDANVNVNADAEAPSQNEEPTNNNHDEEPANNDNGVRTAATSSENFTIPASAVEPAPAAVNCAFCPHGAYAAFPVIFATFAWLACLSKDWCDYAELTGPIVADITNNPDVPFIHVGFNHYREPVYENMEWKIDLTVECQAFNTDIVNIDGVWSFAKITSFLSLVLGGAGALYIWFSTCFLFKKESWRWAGYEMLVAVALLVLTFSWFATGLCHGNDGQDNCTMQYGAQADIVACVLWTIAVLFIFCLYPKGRGANEGTEGPPPEEIEMSNQRMEQEQHGGAATDEHEII